MLMTSYYPGRPRINFKDNMEKALFSFIKDDGLKGIELKDRIFDPTTNIWSFLNGKGKVVYDFILANVLTQKTVRLKRIQGLADQVRAGYVAELRIESFSSEDFFYNKEGALTSTAISKEQILEKLCALLLVPKDTFEIASVRNQKQFYRVAAMRLHPDRNNGDATQMSELNMHWQLYKPFSEGAL
jgi:hypothetical protein